MKSFSRVQLFVTPWTVACQAPPPMGFFRQEYWSGLSFLPFLLLLFHSSTEFSLLEFVWKAFDFSINFELEPCQVESNIGYRYFPFSTLNISCHFLLGCRVSAERSAVKRMGFHLHVTCWFSLVAFNIFFVFNLC